MEQMGISVAVIQHPDTMTILTDPQVQRDSDEYLLSRERNRLQEKMRRNIRRLAHRLGIPIQITEYPVFPDCDVGDTRREWMLEAQILASIDPSPYTLSLMLEHAAVEPTGRSIVAFTDADGMEEHFAHLGTQKIPDLTEGPRAVPRMFATSLPPFTPDGQPHAPLIKTVEYALRYPAIPTVDHTRNSTLITD